MTIAKERFLSNDTIEETTARRVREYESKAHTQVSFPVPIEKIVEQVLGLSFDWDEIEELPGEQILGGLVAEQKKIVLNEKHLDLFKSKPGLERSTIGHEAGHWDVDIDRSKLLHPLLPGIELREAVVARRSRKFDLVVEVLNMAIRDERYYGLYKRLTSGQDSATVRSAVDRYQSALLMPAWLIQDAAEDFDFLEWRDLYTLAAKACVAFEPDCEVTEIGIALYPGRAAKKLYRNRDEYDGQKTLF